MGYSADHRGLALATVGLFATIGGAFVGGWVTTLVGLGHSLWVFGFLQIFSNLGYYFVSLAGGPVLPLMYGATSFELFTSGLGTGAFSVLLLRMTQKRFSATQYALLSSLFTLPRILSGPLAGVLADAIGWRDFFILTVFTGIPGLLLLARFVPWGVRDVSFHVAEPVRGEPVTRAGLLSRAALAAAVAAFVAGLSVAAAGALAGIRRGEGFVLEPALTALFAPSGLAEVLTSGAVLVFAGLVGLGTAALLVARRGVRDRSGTVGPAAE
jgi:PAT family beta-lactamase induction signal transducer AmpG